MSSFPRLVRRGKGRKEKVLGKAQVLRKEEIPELELDARVELIRALVPLALAEISAVLDEEVRELAGERYARTGGSRHGCNPGSVKLAGQRVPIRVPRVRGEGGEIPLNSYRKLRGGGEMDDVLLHRVLYGISCRNYEAAAEAIPGAIGLSSSTVSRRFVEASAQKLKALQERDLSEEDVVAIFLDGKTFAEDTMVLALGITLEGKKRILGFVETATENERVLSQFLRSLVERGLEVSQGILVILDGAKGLRAAVRKCFKGRALVHRCQWHSVPGRAHSKEVRCLPSGRTFKPDSLRQVVAA
jgi:transposase-like protein